MKKAQLALCPKWVLPVIPKNSLLENHTIIINDGIIIDLIDSKTANKKYDCEQTIDLPNHIVMPGLINAHAHSPMVLFRGLADDLPLYAWLEDHIWPAERELVSVDMMQTGTDLAIAEMLLGGTTCFSEHYFYPQITAQSAQNAGIRAMVGLWLGAVETSWCNNIERCFDLGLKTYEDWHDMSEILHFAFAPHGPYIIEDEHFRQLVQINSNMHLPIHMHCHETAQEVSDSLDKYGCTPLERLSKLGILDQHFIGVHMTHMSDDDWQLISNRDCHIVTCPTSNMKLGNCTADWLQANQLGINIACGTDSAASNNTLNLWQDAKLALLSAKSKNADSTCLSAFDAVELLTINGAKALGLDNIIGSIEINKHADLIAIDLNHINTYPHHNPISHLAYAINPHQVSHVWVYGQMKVADGKLVKIDMQDLIEKAIAWQEKTAPFACKL